MGGRRTMHSLWCALPLLLAAACAPPEPPLDGAPAPATGGDRTAPSQRAGTLPVDIEFVRIHENEVTSPLYPLDGVAGCAYSPDGTLIVCDEKRGRVHALDPRNRQWYELDHPGTRPYRPLDAVVDGFKILVLDAGSSTVQRFDLNGAWLDPVVDVARTDPTSQVRPTAFAMDRDGRMVVADGGEQQVLLLDTFLALYQRVGQAGSLDDQFEIPAGIVFLPDGRFVVSDQGNRRLSFYDRQGFFEGSEGGHFDPDNPFVAPAGIDADRFGNVFVADTGSGRIHVVGRAGRYLFSVGPDLGQRAAPLGPVDVAVGPDGTLAVTDRARAAVLVYRLVYE